MHCYVVSTRWYGGTQRWQCAVKGFLHVLFGQLYLAAQIAPGLRRHGQVLFGIPHQLIDQEGEQSKH